MLVAPIVVRLVSRVDPRLLACGGILWIGAMISLRSLWTSTTDFTGIAMPLFAQGLGMPFMFMPLTMLLQNTVSREEAASGAGMQNFARTMAIAIATALILTTWGDGQAIARTALASGMHPDAADAALGSMGMGDGARRAMLSLMIDREAMTLAANRAYLFSALATLLAAGLVWLIPRPSPERLAASKPGGH
jgi:DHA2 family multidrug resistance protein